MRFPYLPVSRIEAAAARLRAEAFGGSDGFPVPVDLEVIVFDRLYEKEDLVFRDDTDLGYHEGEKVLGKTLPLRKQVLVDRSLQEDSSRGRYRFTVAHELGHWVLHRHLFVRDPLQITFLSEVSDNSDELVSLPRNVFPAAGQRRLPSEEWQANRFAIALLIDADLLREEFRTRFGRPYLTADALDCSGSREGMRKAARTAAGQRRADQPSLADRFGLSREAMAIALEERGYLRRTAPLV